METKKTRVRSPLLPVGIAMVMLPLAFSFSAGEARWLWESQPYIAILVAAVGAVMIGTHIIVQVRRGLTR